MSEGRRAAVRFATRLVLAVLAMYTTGMIVSAFAFPYGGGEFHAMFAYSDGWLPAAYRAFRVYVGTVCAVAGLLVAAGYRLPWNVLALAAAGTACRYWWSVYTWEGQSPVFHRTAGVLLLAIPPIAFAVCGTAHAIRRRVLARGGAHPRVAPEQAG